LGAPCEVIRGEHALYDGWGCVIGDRRIYFARYENASIYTLYSKKVFSVNLFA